MKSKFLLYHHGIQAGLLCLVSTRFRHTNPPDLCLLKLIDQRKVVARARTVGLDWPHASNFVGTSGATIKIMETPEFDGILGKSCIAQVPS